MNHEQWRDMIYGLYDGELDEASRELARTHLKDCAPCRDEFARWGETSGTLFRASPAVDADAFVARVMGALEAGAPRRAFLPAVPRWGLWTPALAFAALALAFFGGPEADVSTEALLLAGGRTESALMFTRDVPQEDDAMGLVMEEDI